MGLLDIFKTKKKGPELYWKQMDLIEGADVGFYIKKILADNSKLKGYIYIHEEPYEFWQTPSNHLNGKGCPFCSKSKN